nr:hypothetical protein [Corynebacterium sp. J010B-136]
MVFLSSIHCEFAIGDGGAPEAAGQHIERTQRLGEVVVVRAGDEKFVPGGNGFKVRVKVLAG